MKGKTLMVLAALLFPSAAFAQSPPGTVGLISEPTSVTMHSKSFTWRGKLVGPGDSCQLIPGDRVEMIGVLADGKALVKQKFVAHDPRKVHDRCVMRTLVSMPASKFEAAVKAKAAADAAKALKKSSVASRT